MNKRTMGRIIATALLGSALAGCSVSASIGLKTLDIDKLERTITAEIGKDVDGRIEVSCPDNVEAQAGHVFHCTVTADDGSTGQVLVTQTDDQGNVEFRLV